MIQFIQAAVVGLAEFADGLVANLADTFALEVHILGNLCHRLTLLTDAEESIHNPTLTRIEGTEGKLNGGLDRLGMDALIGQRSILIDEHGKEAHISAMAYGSINGKRHALLTGKHLVLHILGYLIEACLLFDGFLDLLTDMYHSVVDEAHTFAGIEIRSSLHQSEITFADKVFHSQTTTFILTGNRHDKTQVCFHEFGEGALIALPDALRELAFLFIGE